LSILPLAHSFGCAFEFLWPINRGTHIFFLKRKPTPTILLDAYKQVRPHLILSVPLIFEKIYKNKVLPVIRKKSVKTLLSVPIVRGLILKKIRNSLIEALGGRFREVVLGGAPLNNEVEQFFRKIKFPFTVGYGMTECGPLISYASWKITKPGSCGKLVDTLEAKVLWQQPDLGEICVRGENVMKGYYKSPELTAQAIDKDGWLHTGDLGYIDEENFIFLKGRSKSLLLGPSGENIFPEEIEALYLNQPYVEEVLVVMRDNKLVAMIYPDLKLMEKNNVSWEQLPEIFEQLRRKINQQLPHFKRIARIEIRKEEFEKTPKRSIKRYLYQ
jgi:long-chain acyl-CoA synthetase